MRPWASLEDSRLSVELLHGGITNISAFGYIVSPRRNNHVLVCHRDNVSSRASVTHSVQGGAC